MAPALRLISLVTFLVLFSAPVAALAPTPATVTDPEEDGFEIIDPSGTDTGTELESESLPAGDVPQAAPDRPHSRLRFLNIDQGRDRRLEKELEELGELKKADLLTEDEYQKERKKLLDPDE